jgi:hypothetical protein
MRPTPQDRPFHDVRATHDMASLRFDAEGPRRWTIIDIDPAPHSGSATMVGVALDGASGALVDVRTGEIVTAPEAIPSGIVHEGSWTLVASLAEDGDRSMPSGRYSWTEPAETRLHRLTAASLYDPFARGGLVLCRHDPTLDGSAQFHPVYLVPPDWVASVQAAHAVCRADPAVFSGPDLPSLLHGEDPLLAAMAFRALAEAAAVDAIVLRHTIGRATAYRRAILVYLVMLHASDLDLGPRLALEAELAQVVANTSAPEQQRALVLGVVTARLLHPELSTSQELAPRLIDAQLRRMASTPGGTQLDGYTRQLLEAAGLGVR